MPIFNGQEQFTIKNLFLNAKDTFTYEFWVKPFAKINIPLERTSGISGIRDQKWVIGAAHGGINSNIAGTGISVGRNGICVFEHSHNYLPATLVYKINITEFTHIAIVFLKKTPYLYINGKFVRKGLMSIKKHVFPSGIIGGLGRYGNFVGQIKQLRIWNCARTTDQIRENMQKDLNRNEKNLLYSSNLIEPKSKDSNSKMNNIVIYTAITNNYDTLREPTYKLQNCDYLCFTDNSNLDSKHWTIKKIEHLIYDHNRNAKQYKILPHRFLQEYEYSIWIDGNVDIIGDVTELINKYLTHDVLAFYKHPERQCIYDELEACLKLTKDDEKIMIDQINKYRSMGFPKNKGLIRASIILRKHDDKNVIKTMEEWWKEILNHSKRDQLSFNYIAWKNNLKYRILPGDPFLRNDSYFKIRLNGSHG